MVVHDSPFVAEGMPTAYGRGLLADRVRGLDHYVIVAHPEPWERLRGSVDHEPALVITATELTPSYLEHLVRSVPDADAVIGIGGPTALDAAKWLHWRCSLPLYVMPSLPSVTACFARPIGLPGPGGSRPEGEAWPEQVLIDFDLMWSAPPALVRAGVGDLLCCHTALFDWQLASDAGWEPLWDDELAGRVEQCIDEVASLAPVLAAGEDDGLRRLMECHRDLNHRRDQAGHHHFAEGSEHLFADVFADVTGRTIMHGELVTLGALVMAAIQGNQPQRLRAITDSVMMRTDLTSLGLSWSDVVSTLRRLPVFVAEHGLRPSIASGLVVDDEVLALSRQALRVL